MKNYLITDIAIRFVKMYKEDMNKLKTLVKVMELDNIFKVDDNPMIRFTKIYRMKEHELDKLLNSFDLLDYEFNQIL